MIDMEEQANYLQDLKKNLPLKGDNPRDKLLSELVDTVSLLCHQVYRMDAVVDGLNETLEMIQTALESIPDDEEEEWETDETGDILGIDEYFAGDENTLYEVKCPSCGGRFAVDEASLEKGFACPDCGQPLIQAP